MSCLDLNLCTWYLQIEHYTRKPCVLMFFRSHFPSFALLASTAIPLLKLSARLQLTGKYTTPRQHNLVLIVYLRVCLQQYRLGPVPSSVHPLQRIILIA